MVQTYPLAWVADEIFKYGNVKPNTSEILSPGQWLLIALYVTRIAPKLGMKRRDVWLPGGGRQKTFWLRAVSRLDMPCMHINCLCTAKYQAKNAQNIEQNSICGFAFSGVCVCVCLCLTLLYVLLFSYRSFSSCPFASPRESQRVFWHKTDPGQHGCITLQPGWSVYWQPFW